MNFFNVFIHCIRLVFVLKLFFLNFSLFHPNTNTLSNRACGIYFSPHFSLSISFKISIFLLDNPYPYMYIIHIPP